TNATFFSLQYMGSFPVAIPDIASRAEYVRSQLETLRVSTLSDKIFFVKTVVPGGRDERQGVSRTFLPVRLSRYAWTSFLLLR
ncbi:hypothetical protein WH47_05889, partial [Habropoda laboriosa]